MHYKGTSIPLTWTKENHLTFNVAKCKYMLISRKRQAQPTPDLFLDNVSLERVQYLST